jgi:hypothetical protein
MVDLRMALSFAKQYRTCPPVSMRNDPACAEFMKQHLSICPYCSAEGSESLETWDELVEGLQTEFAPCGHSEEPVLPGQIRFIRPDRACRRKGFFYNPPGVLVLKKSTGVKDGFRVAQTYHDTCLAGPGDLVLNETQTSAGTLMVECWNTYSMKGLFLGPVVGGVPDEVLDAARRMEKDPDNLPSWAEKPMPMEEHDVRLYFRELEVEVGYTFAAAAVSEIMEELERPRLLLAYDSVEEMKAEVEHIIPGISWSQPFAVPEEGLTSAKLPTASYAMAAADDESEVEIVNFVRVMNGLVKEIIPIQAEIIRRAAAAGELAFHGRIIGMPQTEGEHRLLAFLTREGQYMLPAAAVKWDPVTGHFATKFKKGEGEHGRLKLAVFCCADYD